MFRLSRLPPLSLQPYGVLVVVVRSPESRMPNSLWAGFDVAAAVARVGTLSLD